LSKIFKNLLAISLLFLLVSAILQLYFTNDNPILLTTIGTLCLGLGWVIVWGPSTTAAISSVPRDAAGVASGAFTTIQEIGGTFGLAITSTVFAIGTTFLDSFHGGVWVLAGIALLGVLSSLFLTENE
jgi:MFS family permease